MFIVWINSRMFYYCEDIECVRDTLSMLAREGEKDVEVYAIGTHLRFVGGKWKEHCNADAEYARRDLAELIKEGR